MEFQKKKVLVAGSGISGIGSCELLLKHGVEVYLYDGNAKLDKEEILARFSMPFQKEHIYLGEIPEEIINVIDILVLSPGISPEVEFVQEFQRREILVIGEIELAYLFGKGSVIGITGTNGKTTTTSLTGKIMGDYFSSTFVVGNIGTPYTSVVDDMREDTVTVAEISSFQLETTKEFRPHVAAILNITPDHLNRHHTMENYISVKCDITKAQTKEDFCVLNYDNEITRSLAERISSTPMFFSRQHMLEEGICLDGEEIVYLHNKEKMAICNISELPIPGNHSIENVMAATAIGIIMGVPIESIRASIKEFKAVAHRNEYVEEKNGVVYYNDSKGTNTDAAIQAINSMSRPTVLLAGGYDKGSEYDDWIKACVGRVKCMVLIGETKEKIAKVAKEYGIENIILKDTFEDAMEACVENAGPGDAVLLSPACASWDMFRSYEQRGDMFKEYVRNRIS